MSTSSGPGRATIVAIAATVLMVTVAASGPAAAQFSAREGFNADGTSHWSFEVTPYLFLPNINANIGLNHPPGYDVSINQNRPTVAQLRATLTGAFVAYGLARYGDWSAELNVFYVAGGVSKIFPPITAGGPGTTLKTTASEVIVSPGFGYQVLPTDASSKVALDARAGFTYNNVSAGANFTQSRFGGVNTTQTFVQPWLGGRVSYYPSTSWRITAEAALTGLGVDGGAIGWNARGGVSYLFTNWFDVTLGYAAVQTRRNSSPGPQGESRNINFLAYGPVMAIGFRF